ncbi:MAG: NAD(P) transhydrogenase subunit alpha [Alphaproteobacteria bacterium]|nr:NAD(P) transhydrogenase subunit alpha [Alphaproteobacteria bacterium]MBN9498039.1 NAD(P) transhydrogenase subunit alpha [Alphaproteobacteria bacterium]
MSDPATLANQLANDAAALALRAKELAFTAATQAQPQAAGVDALTMGLTVLVLATFVGYYVVWRVTPALHSPLMAVTNAISSVIIVGALLAAGASAVGFSQTMGFLAVVLASVNIFGGFVVSQRMLGKFKKKQK